MSSDESLTIAGGETAVSPLARLAIFLPRLLIGLALTAFVGYFIVYAIYAFRLFQFPFDYDQGEGFELMDTLLFSQGEWPYRDNNTYPFYSSNYPPLFHVVIVPLVWLFGPQYWTGRLVSYLGTLITAAAIGYAVQRQGRRWWLSALAGLAFLASNYVYHVGPLFRQHMFMVMFETLAVVLMAATIQKEEASGQKLNGRLLLVMALLLAAGYTKQLAYATVAAVFIFFFIRQPKRAVLWAVPFGLVTGLIFLWIDWATNGMWLLNTVTANLNPFIREQAIGLFRQWFTLHTVITVAALLFAAYQLYFERLSLYSIWFVAAVLNSVTAGKWGAGESYFATAVAASCILTGLAFHRVLAWAETRDGTRKVGWQTAVLTLIGVLFLVQANKMFHMPTDVAPLRAIAAALGKPTEVWIAPQTSCSAPREPEMIPYVDSAGVSLLGRPPTAADTAAGIQIANFIAEGQTAAFSEEAGFNFYIGRDIVTNPTQLLNLYNNNQVDLTEMLAMLDAQAFDSIVLRAQFYPPPVLDAIGQRYETVELVQMNGFVYCLMRPR
jgi:4-amino-4-deoxy-L-arabinose transferase-like glycosyltransferase